MVRVGSSASFSLEWIPSALLPSWHYSSHGVGPKSLQIDWSCKAESDAKMGVGLWALCPWNTGQPGGGGGEPLWAPSGWGMSRRTCFISDHTVCFLEYIMFHSLLKWGELGFKMTLAFCHSKLNQATGWQAYTPEKPKINANFNKVVCLSFSLQLISLNGHQIQSKDRVKDRKLRKKKCLGVSPWF